jgi:hypothetical protein
VLIGCVLAYITRNLDSQFGEAKQLMFSMYNIGFILLITTVIVYTMDIDTTGQIVLKSIGIFWGTVFSSAAFVLPRLMRVQSEKKLGSALRDKKSNVGRGGRESKVRFISHEEHKCSIASDGGSQQKRLSPTCGTEKKSNQTEHTNPVEDSESKPGAYDKKSQTVPSKASMIGTGWSHNETPSAVEESSEPFDKGTGWSVSERVDPNASVGRWGATSGEMRAPEPCKGGKDPQHIDTNSYTGNSSNSDSPVRGQFAGVDTASEQFRMPSEEFSMSTIREGDTSESPYNDDSNVVQDPLV